MKRFAGVLIMLFVIAQVGYSQLSSSAQKLENEIKAKIDTNYVDRIEGIYKTIQGAYIPYYRIGIYKCEDSNLYKAVIIDSESSRWGTGTTKAYFEPVGDDIYSVKWFMNSKRPAEVFGGFKDNGFLEILTSAANSDDTQLVKLYPPTNRIPGPYRTPAPDNTPNDGGGRRGSGHVASGTGFLISPQGYIATNAHVVEGANAVTVDLLDLEDIVHQYKARIVKVDNANDVAIIKIEDEKFAPFNELPYSIESRVNVGAGVFTIGFPLNSVMGTNFKVSDGIISAKTGIGDDVRYYQISVPLQPGNSGGPLFNKNGDVVGLTTSRLNSEYVGTRVENVNYAIKAMYLLNLIDMVPDFGNLPEDSKLVGKTLEEQIEALKGYVCLIRIY